MILLGWFTQVHWENYHSLGILCSKQTLTLGWDLFAKQIIQNQHFYRKVPKLISNPNQPFYTFT